MKITKLTLLISIFVLTASIPVIAEDENVVQTNLVTIPKWEEFCEAGYENAKTTDRNDVFNVFSFVKAERVKKNYWANRRTSFEKYLGYCKSIDDENDRCSCYIELRKIEKDKNDEYSRQRKQLLYQNNIIISK